MRWISVLAPDAATVMVAGNAGNIVDAAVSGRALGLPGTASTLALGYRQQGKLPWRHSYAPAAALFTGGFWVSPRTATLLALR